MRLRRGIGLAVMTLTVASGCSGTEASTGDPGPSRAPTSSGASPSTSEKGTRPADTAGAERVAQRFVTAANAGDEAGVAATFAENARFDSVGRIYPSRKAIMNDFLVPEVLRAGGRYKVTGQRWTAERYVVDYDFSTGHGGSESFSYAYVIRDGLIRDVIGRYH
ncbi:nuclear transport factor 2 family protein [Actinomadura sp. 6N118]|uniref:nuclear transport factor 2 family protein n=1 Tax=Actinomadura sp. 6N118 TaxID=3375151 RepID=UPI003787D4CD